MKKKHNFSGANRRGGKYFGPSPPLRARGEGLNPLLHGGGGQTPLPLHKTNAHFVPCKGGLLFYGLVLGRVVVMARQRHGSMLIIALFPSFGWALCGAPGVRNRGRAKTGT